MIIKQDYGSLGNDVQTQMLIAPVLSEMVATQAFAIGEQFIVNNTLYKATKAIAIGDTISVGTSASDNCVLSDSITQQIKGEGVRFKYFNKTFYQAFVANTTYTFSLSAFGLGDIVPKGFAINLIGGNNNVDYSGIIYYNAYSGEKPIIYRCGAANSTNCKFEGIVFY